MNSQLHIFDPDCASPKRVLLDGHVVEVTDVFWAYWYLAVERQQIFRKRVASEPPPWTMDEILTLYRFTNAYRASDRVSQYLLQNVIYKKTFDAPDTVFRVLLFKIFNRIDTWEHLVTQIGEPELATFDPRLYGAALNGRLDAGGRLYSGAYIMPSPRLGLGRKHLDHLALLDQVSRDGTFHRVLAVRSLKDLFEQLLEVQSFGRFLAFQYAIDLNYSPHFDFDEMEFVVPGPGALSGMSKCFIDTGGLEPADVIRAMTYSAPEYTSNGVMPFQDLWGRPLQLIDCQNLFCEVDKYARVAFPHLNVGGRSRIKQIYKADPTPILLGYPPKWGLPFSADAPSMFQQRASSITSGPDLLSKH